MNVIGVVLDLLFPPKCPFCRRVVDGSAVCGACEKSLPWTKGEESLRIGADELLCSAPLFYEETVRDALLRLKFHGADHLARPLGELLARCAAERFSGEFDAVTWVPVGPGRLKKRGYDQARLLAESACRLWGTAPERLLVKNRDNPAQSGLADAAARRANVLGMYGIAPGAQVAGRRILLIDDICTTGSTLTECVRTLRSGGAERVFCAVVARTRPEGDTQRAGAEKR